MRATTRALAVLALAGTIGFAGAALADNGNTYEVTVTNITQGQVFTPLLVVAHQPGVGLFELGSAASAELEELAEMGNTGPLAAAVTGGELLDLTNANFNGASSTFVLEITGATSSFEKLIGQATHQFRALETILRA